MHEAGVDWIGIEIDSGSGNGKDYKRSSRRVVVMVDGGFRRGSDVVKGLAADGEQNVRDTVATITVEPKRILSMVGAPDVQNVGRGILISKATL
ncbi:MAG: hypothetical protein JRI39_13400 [Deltaproteobacteria bacterium]|nr:hypothetical protein [Deltaproteobacteria bacterium]MBW2084029.1 hypothetical protein [Deltaproteobacteria bacterium]HDM08926.1 hypothetical protein [Desulfobacteraceae bacterium]